MKELNFNPTNCFFFALSKFPFPNVRWKRMKICFILQMPVSIQMFRIVQNDVLKDNWEGRIVNMSHSSEMKIKRPSCRWTEEERKEKTWLNTCNAFHLKLYSIQLAHERVKVPFYYYSVYFLSFFAIFAFSSFQSWNDFHLRQRLRTNDVVYDTERVSRVQNEKKMEKN